MADIPVTRRVVIDTGRKYEDQYSHPNLSILQQYVADVVKKIDTYRSPRAGIAYKLNDAYHIHVTYYGLD